MSAYFAMVIAIVAGALTSVQSAINAELGKYVGGVGSALISFIVGTLSLAVLYLAMGEGGLKSTFKAPAYLLIGGFFGAIFVFSMVKLVPLIGTASVMSGVIAGQLLLAIVIDHFGLFGLSRITIGWTRGLGVALLLIGVRLITK